MKKRKLSIIIAMFVLASSILLASAAPVDQFPISEDNILDVIEEINEEYNTEIRILTDEECREMSIHIGRKTRGNLPTSFPQVRAYYSKPIQYATATLTGTVAKNSSGSKVWYSVTNRGCSYNANNNNWFAHNLGSIKGSVIDGTRTVTWSATGTYRCTYYDIPVVISTGSQYAEFYASSY